MTPGEIFLETIKPDGRPERMLKQYEALKVIVNEPLNRYLRGNRKRGMTSKDRWGTTILFPEDAPGAVPSHTEENKVLKDITHWRDYVKAPDLMANCLEGWEPIREEAEQYRKNGLLVTGFMGTGIFEQCHFLMGFEDTLANFYEHPQEMHELIEYIFEYRLTYVKILIENLRPDAVLSHDDWGTKDSLFMKEEIWREFFKEPYRKFYGYIRSQGVIAIHHADSYLVPIIEDMAEIGIQVWQGTLPENDIPVLLDRLQGRMTLMGGIGAVIDRADATPEEIEAYVMKTLKTNCPFGHFIPCITYGMQGTIFPQVDPVIDATIDQYNAIVHVPEYRAPKPVRRVRKSGQTQAVKSEREEEKELSIFDRIADALCKGQREKTVALCEQARADDIDAQTILSDGLVKGMVMLGEDFSSGIAFVPEMLLAARCMNAATALLKEDLMGSAGESLGKICIGTVSGDMHDIGKNLVKIMMEGNGIEVVDLGSDVSAEEFVSTAIEEECDMIVCSALLTTTMPEMRRVVELAKEEGIRDQIRIMIGGAPITQEYCDEIGADYYTDDAATAASVAVQVLRDAAK